MKLTMLKPRVATLRTNTVKTVAATERPRGGNWMRTITRILRRDHGLCQCSACQAAPAPRVAQEIDHIVELIDGGSNDDANLQSLNAECHARKTAAEAKRRASGR